MFRIKPPHYFYIYVKSWFLICSVRSRWGTISSLGHHIVSRRFIHRKPPHTYYVICMWHALLAENPVSRSLVFNPRPTVGFLAPPPVFYLISAKLIELSTQTCSTFWAIDCTRDVQIKSSYLPKVGCKWRQSDAISGRFWCKIRVYKDRSPGLNF